MSETPYFAIMTDLKEDDVMNLRTWISSCTAVEIYF